jgi:hypothetical protein
MIISEKQIMKLIAIVQAYGNHISASDNVTEQMLSQKISLILGEINNQQSDELKVVE